MAFPNKEPLVEYALNSIFELSIILNEQETHQVREIFRSFLSNPSSFNALREKFLTIIDNPHPMDKLKSIVEIPDEQIPDRPIDDSSLLNQRKKTRTWTSNEDLRLLKAIHKIGLDNWNEVARYVGNGRSRSQCSQRWIRVLDPRISKSNWSPEEDEKLISFVQAFGEKSWAKISHLMGTRSDVQCRYRYQQLPKQSAIHKAIETISQQIPKSSIFQNIDSEKWKLGIDENVICASEGLKCEERLSLARGSLEMTSTDKLFDSSFWVL